jgi:hypothetical protein
MIKICLKCDQKKDISEFHKNCHAEYHHLKRCKN